jgi:hypothetical protein
VAASITPTIFWRGNRVSAPKKKRVVCERRYNSAGQVYEVTETGVYDKTETGDYRGVVVHHHPLENCDGTHCPFHNPSDHVMLDWPMQLRETGLIERVCPHGIGHPDPDSAQYFDDTVGSGFGVHGCDGCCVDPLAVLNTKLDRVVKIGEGS